MSNNHFRTVGVFLGILVVLFLILEYQPSEQPEIQPGSYPSANESSILDRVVLSRAPNIDGTIQETSTDSSWLTGLIKMETGERIQAGSIDFAPPADIQSAVDLPPAAKVTTAEITLGEFTFPSWWLEEGIPAPEAFLLITAGGIPSQVNFIQEGDEVDIILTVGKGRSFALTVTDLDGQPVPDAFVQIFSPGPLEGLGGSTDAEGKLAGTVFGASSNLGLRVHADGYMWNSKVVDLDHESEFNVRIMPIYAAVILRRDWASYNFQWDRAPGNRLSECSRHPSLSDLSQRIVENFEPAPLGYIYDVQLAYLRESVAGDIPTLRLSVRGPKGRRALIVEMTRVSEGLPGISTVPEEAYPDDMPQHVPVLVTLEPKSAFLAKPPTSIRLLVVAFEEERGGGEGIAITGALVSGTTYQFFLPQGRYLVGGTEKSRLDDIKYQPLLPRFLEGSELHVADNLNSRATVFLHPDERFVRYDLQFAGSGRPITMAATLVPDDGQKRMNWPIIEPWPRPAFIRPGPFDVWFIDRSLGRQGLNPSQVIAGGLLWPSPVTANGIWHISVTRKELSAFSFTSG